MSGPTPEKALLGVPDRWMHCPKTGKIINKIFFPFKTPLCALYDNQIDKKLRFHPTDVFEHNQIKGKKIGLWIDLTKTDRYYSPQEVESRGCKYRKMPLAGHKSTPSKEDTDRFVRLVHGHITENPNDIIGIHCTHGFNRTGFLITAYFVLQMDWAVDAAVLEFAKQRPCGIYKQDYINDLFERFEGGIEDAIEAPSRPSWEYNESTGMVDDNDPVNASSNGPSTSNGNGNGGGTSKNGSIKQFMDGKVNGVELLQDQTKKKMLQGKIRELCGYRRDGFPGSQPVSLERSPARDNLAFLQHKPYMVSWKADGMRYMIYISDENEIYAFDRDNEVFQIHNLRFPHRKEPRHVRNTLVDAEMIIDQVVVDGQKVDMPRLLIYDIIHYEQFAMHKMNFDLRRQCIDRELIGPRTEAKKRGEIIGEHESMSVRIKQFWDPIAIAKLFEPKFTANVGHEIDGLIFQPVEEPYMPGRQDSVLKWKPPSHNSIDYKLKIARIQRQNELAKYTGLLYVQHSSDPLAEMKATKTLQQYDGKIIECTMNEKGEWIFMRERTDKSLPNSYNTAMAVYNSMRYPISKENLIKFVEEHGYRKGRRPPPQQSHRGHPGQNGHHGHHGQPPHKQRRMQNPREETL